MQATTWTVAGLLLDIVGVFLLSVEAIKLQNFKRLRDFVLVRAHSPLSGPVLETGVTDPAGVRVAQAVIRSWYLYHLGSGAVTVLLVVLIRPRETLAIVNWAAGHSGLGPVAVATVALLAFILGSVVFPLSLLTIRAAPPVLVALLALASVAFPVTLVLMALGEAAHQGALGASRAVIGALDVLDRSSPSGAIGIIGFTLAFLGFALQIAGAFASRPRP